MIKNKTRGKVLCKETEMAEGLFKKALGLMFRKSLSGGMLFTFSRPAKHGFWTPFMRFPIDILFLDSSKRVVDLVEGLKPWRFYTSKAEASYALELRAGKTGETGTKIGDFLDFREFY